MHIGVLWRHFVHFTHTHAHIHNTQTHTLAGDMHVMQESIASPDLSDNKKKFNT